MIWELTAGPKQKKPDTQCGIHCYVTILIKK